MKKAIIITSAIEVDNNYPLTYSNVRSFFNSEERFRQTVSTIASWDILSDEDTTIYLLDVSDNFMIYGAQLFYQKNLRFIGIKESIPEIWHDVRTHKNKSYCEQTIINSFLKKYKEELSQYDYFIKFSGRYLTDRSFNMKFFDTAPSGFYFKHPLKFDWNDSWGYQLVDRRHLQNDNKLYQYSSVIYGWSSEFTEAYENIGKVIIEFCSHPRGLIYDVETLLYFFTRQYEKNITHMPWIVYGWDGTNGRFLRY